MFTSKYDPGRHIYMVVKDARFKDSDYPLLIEGLTELDREGVIADSPVAFVLLADAGAPPPDARWRQLLSNHHTRMQSPRVFIAVVTRAAVSRGVFTAIRWLTREPAHVKSLLFATIDEAAEWIEEMQGTPARAVRAMHAEVRARSTVPPPMVARAR